MPAAAAPGAVAVLRRHPVKSMLGEELAEAALGPRGVGRDRALALVDLATVAWPARRSRACGSASSPAGRAARARTSCSTSRGTGRCAWPTAGPTTGCRPCSGAAWR